METKIYDLEDRTLKFAIDCRLFLAKIPKTISNNEDAKQLVRSSGSVGANYIEANESLSKKDFCYRIKICRKESKESRFWLKILKAVNVFENEIGIEISKLIRESEELKMIFSSIVEKSKP
jgi:four helix bundle protein